MIFPIIAPLVGLAIIVLISIRLSNRQAKITAEIRSTLQQKQEQILNDDRLSDQRLLDNLGNSDDAASLVQIWLDDRATVFASGRKHPEEWDQIDLQQFFDRCAKSDIQAETRPLILKGIMWFVGVTVLTIISVVICFKVQDTGQSIDPGYEDANHPAPMGSLGHAVFSDEDFVSEEKIDE